MGTIYKRLCCDAKFFIKVYSNILDHKNDCQELAAIIQKVFSEGFWGHKTGA